MEGKCKMILEKVFYLNIDALSERRIPMERSFDRLGVPISCRERFLGIDGSAYDSVSAMLDDAPFWMEGVLGSWMGCGTAAYQWGIYRLYSWIASLSSGHCAILLLDDCHLTRPWYEYVQLAWELPLVDVVQLHAYDWRPLVASSEFGDRHLRWSQDYLPMRDCVERSDFVRNTHYPGAHALLVSSRGAQKCCNFIASNPTDVLDEEWGRLSAEWEILSPVSPSDDYWSVKVEDSISHRDVLDTSTRE